MERTVYMGKLERNLILIQAHGVLMSLIFVLPVLVPLYQDRGLGFREFMIGEALFSAVVILTEVPSGWLSDVWNRCRTMAAAATAHIIGWGMLWQADSFAMTITAQAMLGVGVSLFSGTNSALLYDSLEELGRAGEFRHREGKRHAFTLYAVALSSLLGGFLYHLHPDLPILMTMAGCAGALGVALLLVEPGRHKEAAHPNPFVDMAVAVRYAVRGHPDVAGVVLLAAVLFAGTKMLMWAQQPYYIMLAMPAAWFGICAAAGFLLGGLGGHFGHLIDGRFRNVPVLLAFMLLVVGACLLAAFLPGYHAVPLLLAGSMIYGFGWPRVQAAINSRVNGSRRATILSAASLMVHLLAIPLFIVMGGIDEAGGITLALATLAGIMAVGMVLGLWLVRLLGGPETQRETQEEAA